MPAPQCTCRVNISLLPRPQVSVIPCPLHEAAADLYTALELYVDHFGDPLKVARAALLKANPHREQETDVK